MDQCWVGKAGFECAWEPRGRRGRYVFMLLYSVVVIMGDEEKRSVGIYACI